ncbi:MAG TPA: malto-oligosyltrehalose trehalohydrolase [Candidatus Sulfotelmatobacter sp.]
MTTSSMTTSSSITRVETLPLGASRLLNGSWSFVLWAPRVDRVCLHLLAGQSSHDKDRLITMERHEHGYYLAIVDDLFPRTRYFYRLDRATKAKEGEDVRELPDPASRFQPGGVHGPSQIVDPAEFPWSDREWKGIPLERSIFYELHVGTFTTEGTFDAVIAQLPYLAALGITTIELMPIAQFPGSRNWGYDGVFPFAPQSSYGGPEGLQRLVNAAHHEGLAVALDVVYNHLGPEGNYLGEFAPYFTAKHQTPWGQAINYDGPSSDEVRRFFIDNALYWREQYHFDALRLDAVHGILDFSATHLLAELKSAAEGLSSRVGRKLHIIAESDLNDSRLLLPAERGGYSLDAQWSDDFHHSVHTLLTKENKGYYEDFGHLSNLAETLREGWCYQGQHSRHRQRKHGNSPRGITSSHFVVCNQNHDQVGNRAEGERLSALVGFEGLKLAAGITLLSPFVPLLFMGEEYGETAPFQYFISHQDADLVEAVRRGRREEFSAFGWQTSVPDPQEEATFARSQLRPTLKEREPHATLLRFYRELISLRNKWDLGMPAQWHVWECSTCVLLVFRDEGSRRLAMLFNFSDKMTQPELPAGKELWATRLCSADIQWKGPSENFPREVNLSKPFRLDLHPHSFAILEESKSEWEPV